VAYRQVKGAVTAVQEIRKHKFAIKSYVANDIHWQPIQHLCL